MRRSLSYLAALGSVAVIGLLTSPAQRALSQFVPVTVTDGSTSASGTTITTNCPVTVGANGPIFTCAGGSATPGGVTNNVQFRTGGGAFGGIANVNNAVLVTNGSGAPSESTTLPNGLAMGTPASLALNNATALPLSAMANLGTTTTVLHGNAAGNPTFSSLNLASDVTGLLSIANGGTGTATPGLVAGTNVTITGSWPNQTINSSGGGGGAGFGVDGGTSASSVTAGGTIGNGVRLVKIASGWASGTLILPAISAVSPDSCIRIEDGGNFVDGTHTLTVAANAVDAINGGSTGGNTGAFTSSGVALSFCVTATHNWNTLVSTAIAATTSPTHQFFNSLSAQGVISSGQPAVADLSGLGTNVATALGNTLNSSSGLIGNLTPTNNNCPVGNGTAWVSVTCPSGSSSVSITAATPNLVMSPSPITGTGTVGTTVALNSQSGNSAYAIASGDAAKLVIRTNTVAQADTIAQATGSFGTGYGVSYVTGNIVGNTITPTTSTINGLASIKLGKYQGIEIDSDNTNYYALLGVPQPATQTGSTFLRDDMTWQTVSASSFAIGSTTITAGTAPCLVENSASTTSACAGVGSNVITALGNNLSAGGGLVKVQIPNGQQALGTSAIASNTCATVITISASGVVTTDVIDIGYSSDPHGVTGYAPGGGLYIQAYPTSNNINILVCNASTGSVTPGALTINYAVRR